MPRQLIGTWSLDRRVLDRRIDRSGCVHGRLVVCADDAGLRWDEDGTLRWEGRTAPVTRSLRLRRRAEGWWMHFADERPFHPWRPGVEVVHECGPDVYRGTITVHPDGRRMRTVWSVTGPGKDQLLVTRLRRL